MRGSLTVLHHYHDPQSAANLPTSSKISRNESILGRSNEIGGGGGKALPPITYSKRNSKTGLTLSPRRKQQEQVQTFSWKTLLLHEELLHYYDLHFLLVWRWNLKAQKWWHSSLAPWHGSELLCWHELDPYTVLEKNPAPSERCACMDRDLPLWAVNKISQKPQKNQ